MSIATAFKQSLKRPSFMIVMLVLLVGAVGINAATSALHLFFRKEALPLKAELSTLPLRMGDWVCVPETHTVDPDMEHALGTDKYVFRTYVDVTAKQSDGQLLASESEIKAMASLKREELEKKLSDLRRKNTNAVLTLAVTYYTGKVDTVPHVPERCYVADGYQPVDPQVYSWKLGKYESGTPRDVKVRFIDFEDQTGRSQANRCVTYFFHANGRYEESPNQVRIRLQNLFEKYGYFAKIEVMTLLPPRSAAALDVTRQKENDRRQAGDAVQRFLASALPEVEKLLPSSSYFTR